MSQNNDNNTRHAVRAGHDQLSTLLAHFSRPDATWENFGKADVYVELLRLTMMALGHCVDQELQERASGAPTDFGT